jgi:hypothetical protein
LAGHPEKGEKRSVIVIRRSRSRLKGGNMWRVFAICSTVVLLSVTASNAACRWTPEDGQDLQYQYRRLVSGLIRDGISVSNVTYLADHWSTVMIETSPMDVDNRQKLRDDYRRLSGQLIREGMPSIDAVNMAFQNYKCAKATTPPCAR